MSNKISLDKVLQKQKEGMVEYLQLKAKQEDWHGVADAAMDIREIEAKLRILDELTKLSQKMEGDNY